MTQLLNLLETETLNIADQAILNQDGIDKRISLQLAGVLSWAEMNGFTYSGEYTDDPTILTSTAFVYFEGAVYFASESASLPYNTNSTTYSSPEDDPNLYKALEYNTVNNNIGTGSTNYAAGDHTHVQADITDLSGFIEAVVDDTSPQLGGTLDVNGNLIEDSVNNRVRIDASETRLTQTTSANCQLHTYASFASEYPTGQAGYFINSFENFGSDEFYIKKQNNSTVIQFGSDIDENTIGMYSPVTANNGLSGFVNQVDTSTSTVTSGATGVYVNITTGGCTVTLSNTFVDDKYKGNIVEFIFPYATSRTIINNTGLPLVFIYPGQSFTTIPNGGSFGMSNYGRFIQTTSTGNYNLFLSF